ncbi:vitellogenin receptor-like, partial [Hyposmocoma kahamanoa]|uniref:vitellogenin receptor-like n=1 Tax=Hyposmocoma kahamanoa TaxID=1477025 RepID=UPI000E6D769A
KQYCKFFLFSSPNEFTCDDNACVSVDHVCDGKADCADESDEAACLGSSHNRPFEEPILTRSKRQSTCSKHQWQCSNGECVSFDAKCDGVLDCTDGSDETFALCRKTRCQSNWFRCTYGACVDGTAPCNGQKECVDNSDELLPRCRNETDEIRFQFTCDNGRKIPASSHCDGIDDCGDVSDETVKSCAGKNCPSYLFQCAYGACVDAGSDCNGIQECADNSDESDELCNRIGTGTITSTTTRPVSGGNCVLPPYPENGRYTVGGVPQASPGQSFNSFQLNVSCNPGYNVIGNSTAFCIGGSWFTALPQCGRFCKVNRHPSVQYRCLISEGENGAEGTRECNELEPSGTIVQPTCRAPNYYHSGLLGFMKCVNGNWDHVATCTPGLIKNGVNITILITDKLEVLVNNLIYYEPLFPNPRDKNVPNTNDDEGNDEIDPGDWRIGNGEVKLNVGKYSVEVKFNRNRGVALEKKTQR